MSQEIQKKLKQFKSLVLKTISSKSRLYIFGSYAKKTQNRWSDIDVAIVVPRVTDRFNKEINLRLKSLFIDDRINPIIFTSKEFSQSSPLTWEIKKYGVEV